MRTVLKFSGILCCIAAVGCAVFSLLGESGLLPAVVVLFIVGIVLLALASILDRLTQIEFRPQSSRADGPDRVPT